MGNHPTKLTGIFKKKDYREINVPTEEELQQVQKIMNGKDESFIQKMLDEKMKGWMEEELLCAVSGNTGTGKSSLVNAIRDLTPMEEGAAAVNVIESTKKPTPYPDPNNKNLIYYDLPGVGTKNFPRETYLEDINFEKYDFYFIVTSCRFTENDMWLADQVRKAKKSFYFIRTKIDEDVRNQKRDYKQDEATVLKTVREHTLSCLENEGFEDPKVYLISNHDKDGYDFSKLLEDVIKNLPDHKKEAMVFSIRGFSETIVMEKKKYLKRFVYLAAVASAGFAAVPIPGLSIGVDIGILMAVIKLYRHVFGLSDKDIKKIGIPTERLKFIALASSKEAVVRLLSSFAVLALTEEGSRAVSFIVPILANVVASVISFITTYMMLNHVLDKMADDGMELIKYRMEEKFKDMEM